MFRNVYKEVFTKDVFTKMCLQRMLGKFWMLECMRIEGWFEYGVSLLCWFRVFCMEGKAPLYTKPNS